MPSAALTIMNSTISQSLQLRLPLSFVFSTSSSLSVRTRSGTAPLLVGSSVTWRRKLSSVYSRRLLDCPAVWLLQWTLVWLKSPMRTRSCDPEAALTDSRGPHPLGLPGWVACSQTPHSNVTWPCLSNAVPWGLGRLLIHPQVELHTP